MSYKFASIQQALQDLANGKMVILIDDKTRENEGDLVIAAEHVSPETINFMIINTNVTVIIITGINVSNHSL